MLRVNWLYMLLAGVMSVALWYMVTGQERVETLIELRLEFRGMPPGLIVKDGLEKKISVRLRGPKGLIRSIDDSQLTHALDLSNLKKGTNIVPVLTDRLPITRAFEVVDITPSRLVLDVDALVEREVPIDVRVRGELPPDIAIEGFTWEPPLVRLRGAESVLDTIRTLKAEVPPPTAVEATAVVANAPIIVPKLTEAVPSLVQVSYRTVIIKREVVLKRTIQHVPLEGSVVQISPKQVSIRVEAPRSMTTNKELLKQVTAHIDIPDATGEAVAKKDAEPTEVPVRVVVPEGVQVVDIVPATVAVTVYTK